MVEILIDVLKSLGWNYGFFRVIDYISFRVMVAALTSLLIAIVFGHSFIVRLYSARFRDTGGDYLALNTRSKRGTPTAGGLLILLSVGVSLLLWGRWWTGYVGPAAAAFFYFGFVGLFDDWLKVRFQSSLFGLGQLAKTVLQLAFIVPFALWFISPANPLPPEYRTTFYLPFAKSIAWDPSGWLFAVFIVFAFYSIVNAVNITDGLDGLVSGPAVMTAALYGAFAYILGNTILARYFLFTYCPGAGEMAVFGAALAGGIFGFLWFNAYPAEVFMGDTGAMSIGAALAAMAFFTRQEMLFPIVGGVFVASIASSLIQEKIGNRLGRRIFLRAPLHHGQTHRGIAEPKVVVRYWIVSILLTLVAALSIKVR